ncbi:MAG: putative DNA binding domain-containing protein [Bacteroidales bacterium]|nr:putative DNA binding domain-containing protein [Bacteroidales bacterium]
MDSNDLNRLLDVLIALPKETEWVEFKSNFHSETEIGERLSALSNSACLLDKSFGYLVFGVEDGTHKVLGTNFHAKFAKKGNEELEHWLLNRLNPKVDYEIFEFDRSDNKHVSLFRIPAATSRPVSFFNVPYIRVGSITQRLQNYPDKEAKIWKKAANKNLAGLVVKEMLTPQEIVSLLSVETYFNLMKIPFPKTQEGIIERFEHEHFIKKEDLGWSITQLGAILLAKDLRDFGVLSRKGIRVIVYKGKNKIETIREQAFVSGYAVCMDNAIDWINGQLPANEVIGEMMRENVSMYPKLAVRELMGNLVIHQDFSELGTPMIEIYSDRIDLSNPGVPLVSVDRFIDEYQSRNEALADIMRRMGFCEEKGSGLDKVIALVEAYQLPPVRIKVSENRTSVTMEAYKTWSQMDKNERIQACYQHTCLKYVSNDMTSNQSLRERFGIDAKNYPMISRLLKDSLDAGLIKEANSEEKSPRNRKYVPYWG